ncbi:hypothetical protein PSPO01_09880 [Paraphaeosphaeria sporulosa]
MQEPDQEIKIKREMATQRESPANRYSDRVTHETRLGLYPAMVSPFSFASRFQFDASKRYGRSPVWWLVRHMWCKERTASVRLAGAYGSHLIEINTQTSTGERVIATGLWALACVKRNRQRRAQCVVRMSHFMEPLARLDVRRMRGNHSTR